MNYRDAEAIAEAVQRPTMHFRVDQDAGADGFTGPAPCAFAPCQATHGGGPIKSAAFCLSAGSLLRQGFMPLRKAAARNFELKIRCAVAKNDQPHWRAVSRTGADGTTALPAYRPKIEAIANAGRELQRLMSVPGVGPIVSNR